MELTKEEFLLIAKALKGYYPKENLLPTKESMELWYRALRDIPFMVLEPALQKWVLTNKWSPSIAEIRQTCMTVVREPIPDWEDGWKELTKAIGAYGYMQPEKALASMSEITRKVVENLGWKDLCMSENAISDRARFAECYERMQRRADSDALLPQSLQSTIKSLSGEMSFNAKQQSLCETF